MNWVDWGFGCWNKCRPDAQMGRRALLGNHQCQTAVARPITCKQDRHEANAGVQPCNLSFVRGLFTLKTTNLLTVSIVSFVTVSKNWLALVWTCFGNDFLLNVEEISEFNIFELNWISLSIEKLSLYSSNQVVSFTNIKLNLFDNFLRTNRYYQQI